MNKQIVIFDLDGTLADNQHRVHYLHEDPKNWDAFFAAQHLDTVRKDVLTVYQLYYAAREIFARSSYAHAEGYGAKVIILTGRGEEHRKVTEQWLAAHGIVYDALAMRPEGDRTDDHILKMQYIRDVEADGWEVIGLFDDRKRICDAAREHGITVFQMAAGEF